MRGDRVLPGFFHAVALVTRVVVLCVQIIMPKFAVSMTLARWCAVLCHVNPGITVRIVT